MPFLELEALRFGNLALPKESRNILEECTEKIEEEGTRQELLQQ